MEDNEEEDNYNYPMFNEQIDTTMGENEGEEDPLISPTMIFVGPFVMHKWTVEVKMRG